MHAKKANHSPPRSLITTGKMIRPSPMPSCRFPSFVTVMKLALRQAAAIRPLFRPCDHSGRYPFCRADTAKRTAALSKPLTSHFGVHSCFGPDPLRSGKLGNPLQHNGLAFSQLFGASYFLWGCASVAAALSIGLASTLPASRRVSLVELACSLVLLSSAVATSHAAARLDHQLLLLATNAAHQA